MDEYRGQCIRLRPSTTVGMQCILSFALFSLHAIRNSSLNWLKLEIKCMALSKSSVFQYWKNEIQSFENHSVINFNKSTSARLLLRYINGFIFVWTWYFSFRLPKSRVFHRVCLKQKTSGWAWLWVRFHCFLSCLFTMCLWQYVFISMLYTFFQSKANQRQDKKPVLEAKIGIISSCLFSERAIYWFQNKIIFQNIFQMKFDYNSHYL